VQQVTIHGINDTIVAEKSSVQFVEGNFLAVDFLDELRPNLLASLDMERPHLHKPADYMLTIVA
jgi:hypothetical protein